MKYSALTLAKFHRTLGALIMSVSASLAQNAISPAPVAPLTNPPAVAPIEPPSAPISPIAPPTKIGRAHV